MCTQASAAGSTGQHGLPHEVGKAFSGGLFAAPARATHNPAAATGRVRSQWPHLWPPKPGKLNLAKQKLGLQCTLHLFWPAKWDSTISPGPCTSLSPGCSAACILSGMGVRGRATVSPTLWGPHPLPSAPPRRAFPGYHRLTFLHRGAQRPPTWALAFLEETFSQRI